MFSKFTFAVVLLFLPLLAFSQVTTGSVGGYVFDPSGRAVPQASITVAGPSNGIVRKALTDASGFYRLADLPPAQYTAKAAASGFDAAEVSFTLEVNGQARADFHLVVAGQQQSLTVRAISTGVPTESSELGAVIDQRRIAGLPLNQRDFLRLALLTSGVTPPVEDSELSSRGAFAMHANGGREEYNNFLLDGVDNNDQGSNRYVLQPSVDSIQEFKIATNNYSAEYGRNAGGQVNVITRGGGNEIHGFGYEYLRNRVLDSPNAFDTGDKAKLIRNQFGGGAGGPIRTDKTYYFASFDALRGRTGATRLGTVPSALNRSGDLTGLGNVVDPFTRAPFPGNRIPASRIAPVSLKILDLYPAANLGGAGGNYFAQPVQRDANSQFNGRIDHQLSSADRLTLRYSYGKKDLFEPFAEDSTDVPGFGDFVHDRGHNAMIQHMRIFSPAMTNSLILGLNRATREILSQNYQTDVNKLWGVNYLPTKVRDYGFPGITVAGYSRVGDVTQLPILRAATTYQLSDTMSIVHGRHGIKFGGEMRRLQHNGVLDLLTKGTMTFSGAISGSGLSDLLLGYPSLAIQAQADSAQTQRSTAVNFFAQDDWKVSRTLTLNFGLRYEYNTPPTDPTDRMSTFSFQTGKIARVGTDGVSHSGIKEDRNNFAPRFGFAWAPDEKTVVRGGYGIFYDAGMLVINTAMYFNPPYFTIRVFFPTATSLLTVNNPFTSGITPAASLSTLDPASTTSYLQHWNFNVQREVQSLGVFSLAYAGSKGTHLINSRDLNQPRPGPGAVQSRAPYPSYSNIYFTGTGANSSYNSLQASFNRRMARGLSMIAAYTWSKSIDDTSAFLSTKADKNFPQDSRNVRADRGLSSFDMPQRLSLAYVYQVPFRNKALRNFETAAIVAVQSGQPFTPLLRFDNSNTGNTGGNFGSDHPNLIGTPKLSNPSAAMWFNTAAFAVPAQYTFGTAGRNIVRAPGYASFDMSLARGFRLTEKLGLRLEAQAFNLFNRTNLDMPERYADEKTTFGRIFSAKSPRQAQLGLRLSF